MKATLRLPGLVYLFCLLLGLAGWMPLKAQNSREIRLQIALNNAALYYQQGELERAYSVLQQIAGEFPDNPDLNYRLAILSYRLLGDMVAYEKYYRKALSAQPGLVDPQLLSDADVAKIFRVQKLNEESINLRGVLQRVRLLFEHRSFGEACTALLVARHYLPHVGPEDASRYHLYLSYAYARLDSLMRAAAEAIQVDEKMIGGPDRALLDSLHQSVRPWLERFLNQHGTLRAALSFLSDLEHRRRFQELLVATQIFSQKLFPYPHSGYWPVQLYRLEALAQLDNWREGLPLHEALSRQLEQAGLLERYADQLNQAYARLTLASIQERVGRTSARADSFLLWGQYAEGMNLYQDMLEANADEGDIQAFLYYSLSKIHAAIGRYGRAREYWQKARDRGMNAVLMDTLKAQIQRAEAFEKAWQETSRKVAALLAAHRPQEARSLLVPLMKSPYLRFGLRARALMLAARVYRQLGYLSWAHSLVKQATRYPADRDSLHAADSLLAARRQQRYFAALPDTSRQGFFRLSFLSSRNGAVDLLLVQPDDLFGVHAAPPVVTAAFGNEASLRGGTIYRLHLDKNRSWRQLLGTLGLFAFSRLYLTFR
ncbi:MAG: hypothetical protein D6715_05895 [Calditrichaeota bacterium]|nr:MAG: hypothetical protein D6715_05895 [Calditrichota bacterium]